MKKSNLVALSLTVILSLTLVPGSWAGSKQRHRWEGVAIGVGAAVLGSVLVHQYGRAHPAPARTVVVRSSGHWEIRKTWVPAQKERIWHEPYYDRFRRRHPGYWEKRHRPGYWMEERVWVEGPPRKFHPRSGSWRGPQRHPSSDRGIYCRSW